MRVIEFAGIGPAPFCGMLLSDLGADVVRIDRRDARPASRFAITERGRRSVAFNLKATGAAEACLSLIAGADILIEGFRPGVMERLGLGPQAALARNPRLVYGRVTGWGQGGPYANSAGHDVNYISLTGVLHAVGPPEQPVMPLNLIADFGGGALYLALGVVSALHHARATGQGQVVDAAMVDGAASLMAMAYGGLAAGSWRDERQANILDGGSHFMGVYPCADGRFISLASAEPQFYALLLEKTGLADDPDFKRQHDRALWPSLKARLAAVIITRTRDQWSALMEGTDVCFAPVLSMTEAPHHPHNVARGTFVEHEGVVQPGPAPRFSATPASIKRGPPQPGEHDESALKAWGMDEKAIAALREGGVLAPAAQVPAVEAS